MAVPIIFVFNRNSDFLKYSKEQPRHFNQDVIICLFGNLTKNLFPREIPIELDKFKAIAQKFADFSKQLSANIYLDVIVCRLKFFVQRNRLKKYGIGSFNNLDFEVVTLRDFNKFKLKIRDYKISDTDQTIGMPMVTYPPTCDSLRVFFDFVLTVLIDIVLTKNYRLGFNFF